MSEIEKMMQNAGINKIGIKRCSGIKQGICQHNCNECESFDYKYQPFTAEKQIELIKFLFNQGVYYSTFHNDTYQFHISDDIENPQPRKFDIAIAEIINDLWQDLTDTEKQQVKGILE